MIGSSSVAFLILGDLCRRSVFGRDGIVQHAIDKAKTTCFKFLFVSSPLLGEQGKTERRTGWVHSSGGAFLLYLPAAVGEGEAGRISWTERISSPFALMPVALHFANAMKSRAYAALGFALERLAIGGPAFGLEVCIAPPASRRTENPIHRHSP
jgi:hypothetical protein